MSTTHRNQRKIRNYLLDPRTQLKYALYFFAFSIIAAILNQMVMVRALQTFLLQALIDSNVDATMLAANVAGPLKVMGLRMTLLFPVFGLCCALFAIRISHRFVGPQVALQRQIDALKRGEYHAQCNLRHDDEMKLIAENLNQLAGILEERALGVAPEELAA